MVIAYEYVKHLFFCEWSLKDSLAKFWAKKIKKFWQDLLLKVFWGIFGAITQCPLAPGGAYG